MVPGSGPSRSVTVGPGEAAIRSGNPASPATTTGGGPQRFPAPPQVSREAFAVGLETAAKVVGLQTGRPAEDVKVYLLEEMDEVSKQTPMSFPALLAEAKRRVLADIRTGVR